MALPAVTFDFGQTLTELDCEFLCQRLAERGVQADPQRLSGAMPLAWRRYDEQCASSDGAHPWHLLMKTILVEGGVAATDIDALVDWLWTEQPETNLWRKPIPGMIELVRTIGKSGIKVGVISNSEGRLEHLAEQLGWHADFKVIADSGKLGFAKPGARIFEWTADQLGVSVPDLVHVGDSWAADVEGIVRLGGRGVWFGGASIAPAPPDGAAASPRTRLCRSADEVEQVLRDWKVLR